MNNFIENLPNTSTNLTAVTALARYAQVLEALGPDKTTHCAVKRMGPDTVATVEALLQTSDFPLPNDLIEFYLEHGGVEIGQGWGSISLFGAARLLADTNDATGAHYPPRHGLLDFIQYVWGGRPEFDEAFSDEQIEQLNHHYLVIGIVKVDNDTHRYLYIDRAGCCGVLLFNQDDFYDEHLEEMLKMLESSPASLDFNAVFVAEIQVMIELLAEKHF